MKKKNLIITLIAFTISCNSQDRDTICNLIEYKTHSNNYFFWSKDRDITWDLYPLKSNVDGICYNYIGCAFYYEIKDSLLFDVRIYFDKHKSWVKPKAEWGESEANYYQAIKFYNLKFDYYECTIRELRKYLIMNRYVLKNKRIITKLPIEYYNKAKTEWNEIKNRIDSDYSDIKLDSIRQIIDTRLEILKDYGPQVNQPFF